MASKLSFAFAVLGFCFTLVIGTVGWIGMGFPVSEAIYRTLLAFGGDGIYAPKVADDPLNAYLTTARLTGLLTTIAALIGLTTVFAGRWVVRQRAKFLRQHTVVVGSDAFAVAQAQSYGAGPFVCLAASDPSDEKFRPYFIEAEPTDIERCILHLGNPRQVILASLQSEQNITLARAIISARPDLAKKIVLRLESSSSIRELDLYAPELKYAQVISSAEQIATAFCDTVSLANLCELRGQTVPHVLFVGMGRVASGLLKEMVMRVHHPRLDALHVDVIDCQQSAAYQRLASEMPRLLEMLEARGQLRFHEMDGECCTQDEQTQKLEYIEQQMPLTAIVVATGDDSRNITIAMRLREIQTTRLTLRAPIFIRNELRKGISPESFGSLTGGVSRFGGYPEAREVRSMRVARTSVAERVHKSWQTLAAREGRRTSDWAELSALQRYSNERAAVSTPDVLSAVGFVPDTASISVPLRIGRSAAALADATDFSPALKACEHARWSIERAIAGYRLAEDGVRDDEMRKHPDLRAFEELDQIARKKDNKVLRELIAATTVKKTDRFVQSHAPVWRRRIRVAVFGPIAPNSSLENSLNNAVDRFVGALPAPLDAYTLEILTPNAPGFDRIAPVALAQRWQRATKRASRLLAFEAMTMDGLNRKALGVGPAESASLPEGPVLDRLNEEQKNIARTFIHQHSVDLRPLGTSDSFLLRNTDFTAEVLRNQIKHCVALADVCFLGLNHAEEGGDYTRLAMRLTSELRKPSLCITPSRIQLSGEWATLARLPEDQ